MPPEVKLSVPPRPSCRKIVPTSGVWGPSLTTQIVAPRAGAPGHPETVIRRQVTLPPGGVGGVGSWSGVPVGQEIWLLTVTVPRGRGDCARRPPAASDRIRTSPAVRRNGHGRVSRMRLLVSGPARAWRRATRAMPLTGKVRPEGGGVPGVPQPVDQLIDDPAYTAQCGRKILAARRERSSSPPGCPKRRAPLAAAGALPVGETTACWLR